MGAPFSFILQGSEKVSGMEGKPRMIYFQNLKTGRVIGLKYLNNAISLTEHWDDLDHEWDVYFA